MNQNPDALTDLGPDAIEQGAAAGLSGPAAKPIKPDPALTAKMERESGVNISACFGCKKCTNGCPLTFAMDLKPYQVVRYAQFGLFERIKNSRTIWVCASCQTCLTRCPNDVDLPRFMDYLKQIAAQGTESLEEERTRLFHRLFLREVKARGRVFEASLMTRYMLGTGGAFGPEALDYAKLGWAMFKRGRMKLLPSGVKDRSWLKAVFPPK